MTRKIHGYLGMNLDYSVKGQVNIIIMDYTNEIMDCFEMQNQNTDALN